MNGSSGPDKRHMICKDHIKSAIYKCNSHKSANTTEDIFLYASRRGGSTLMMNLLASMRGYRYVDQPFTIYSATESHKKHLPVCAYGELIELDKPQLDQTILFASRLLSGELKYNGPWRFWNDEFNFSTSRTVLKITNAKSLCNEFSDVFHCKSLVYYRHPAACAFSLIKNRWPPVGDAYLNNSRFIDNHLSLEQYNFAKKIFDSDNEFLKHIVGWCLEFLIPFKSRDILHVQHESLVLDPCRSIALINERLNIGLDETSSVIAKPSQSSKFSNTLNGKSRITDNDKREAIFGWSKYIRSEDNDIMQDALSCFGYTKDMVTYSMS